MKLFALAMALVGIAFVAALFFWQERLLYFPTPASLEQLTGNGVHAWPAAGELRGLVAEPVGAARATAVVFHGNAGHAGHRVYYAGALAPLGVRVVLAEYPGYGARDGTPGEASLVADAEETLRRAHEQYGAPLVVIGESLGAAVGAAAAARERNRVAGLVLITPWDRLVHVGAHHYPWLPVRWMLRSRYDSAATLARFDRPVVVAVAEHDRVVPARFGIALHAALPGPKRLVVIPERGHNDWPDRVDAAWWRETIDFALGDRR